MLHAGKRGAGSRGGGRSAGAPRFMIDNHSHVHILAPSKELTRAMYVCICNGLTDTRLREAARATGERRSAKAVYRHLGCRSQCGLCLPHAREVIAADEQAPGFGEFSAAI